MLRQCLRRCAMVAPVLLAAVVPSNGQTIVVRHRITPQPRIVPNPRPLPPQRDTPLEVKTHSVESTITDGVAHTRIEQVFFNTHNRIVEGTYIFPLEDGIALGQFSMDVNGKEIQGELLTVEEARSTYESIVAKMRDPALLEYLGTRMFRARIFPINPRSEVRIRLEYTQMLSAEDGLVRYRYPLATDKSLAKPIDTVAMTVHINSQTPIKSIFSPSHKIAANQPTPNSASASFEEKNMVPDRNFELYYTLSEKEFGLTVLTHRPHGEDGYFLARIAPPLKQENAESLPKNMTFVIDTSGSMSGEKIVQAKRSLAFCLDQLNPKDAFNIVSFSHEARRFRDTLTEATPDHIQAAHEFVATISASGGTNINDALLAALGSEKERDSKQPHQVVFLTDGLPTVGVTATEEILQNVAAKSGKRVRLYVFGVGYDVNTQLLDLLAEQNRGTRDYVEPNENLELRLSSFYRKVSQPVLADLMLKFNSLNVFDVFPPVLGDLFTGTEVVVVGRYKGEGTKAIKLTGTRQGRTSRFVDECEFPSESNDHEFLSRLWATRKVGYLLDEIRLHGENQELKDSVVQLATQYGIVTPYTAYLVTEPGSVARRAEEEGDLFRQALRGTAAQDDESNRIMREAALGLNGSAFSHGQRGPRSIKRAPTSKVADVRFSMAAGRTMDADASDLQQTTRLPGVSAPDPAVAPKKERKNRGPMVRHAAGRTFYRVGDRWIDSAFRENQPAKKIELYSTAYFELIRKTPELAKCFALGEKVVVVVDDVAYETEPTAPENATP